MKNPLSDKTINAVIKPPMLAIMSPQFGPTASIAMPQIMEEITGITSEKIAIRISSFTFSGLNGVSFCEFLKSLLRFAKIRAVIRKIAVAPIPNKTKVRVSILPLE